MYFHQTPSFSERIYYWNPVFCPSGNWASLSADHPEQRRMVCMPSLNPSSFVTAIGLEGGINWKKSFGLCFTGSLDLMKRGGSRKILFLSILHFLVMRPLEEHYSVFRLPGRHQVKLGSSFFLIGITVWAQKWFRCLNTFSKHHWDSWKSLFCCNTFTNAPKFLLVARLETA